jgi:hypothetical protein
MVDLLLVGVMECCSNAQLTCLIVQMGRKRTEGNKNDIDVVRYGFPWGEIFQNKKVL